MKTNYRDIDPNFAAHPISGDVAILSDEEAVKQSLRNILWTNFHEKPYKPKYGGNLKGYLFGKINFLEKEVIQQNLLDMIKKYEPRVIDVSAKVSIDKEGQTLIINLYYTIISISERQELNVVLTRVR